MTLFIGLTGLPWVLARLPGPKNLF